MIRILQCKCSIDDTRTVEQLAADYLKIPVADIRQVHIRKRSIDARKKQDILYVYCLDVEAAKEKELLKRHEKKGVVAAPKLGYSFPAGGVETLRQRPIVVGAGPAGLFAALELARHGYRPILLERGQDVETRQRDVEAFWKGGALAPESNVQFGEGGAGTFSDGKLNTMVKDPTGRIRRVLETFVQFGADPAILYDNKPHIGTDHLRRVIRSLREEIRNQGGEIRFGCKVTGFEIRDGQLTGIWYEQGGVLQRLDSAVCVLAIGHSARDTFETLAAKGVPMEAKAFAVGFRMEHPQSMIQESQYDVSAHKLPAAPYKVTAQTSSGRGVYSFCMCPGGLVVNASSEAGFLAVNGMSNHARDGRNANSAIVVTVNPADMAGWCQQWKQSVMSQPQRRDGEPDGNGLAWKPMDRDAKVRETIPLHENSILAGMNFQRIIEKRAYEQMQGKVPVQLFGDYCRRVASTGLGDVTPTICGAYGLGQVRDILPTELGDAIEEGIHIFGSQIRGFDREDALLSGVESRTSSPVRILRGDGMESAVAGLYPCGEGAGYAGGITSAAVDGLKMAEAIVSRYTRPEVL